MKMIGKLDEAPVFEVDRGQYVVVNPETGRWMVTWTWYGNLGRNFDTFMKCSSCDEEDACLEIIEKDKEDILKQLNAVADNLGEEEDNEILDEQDEFYDSLDENREYDWFEGYSDEQK